MSSLDPRDQIKGLEWDQIGAPPPRPLVDPAERSILVSRVDLPTPAPPWNPPDHWLWFFLAGVGFLQVLQYVVRRLAPTPKIAPGDADPAVCAAQRLAHRLAVSGQPAFARNVLTYHGVPVPTFVKREALGVDAVEGGAE